MRRFLVTAGMLVGASVSLMAQTYTVKTLAGKLPPLKDPTQPNAIFLAVPDATVVDADGNLIIADTNSHKVWKITNATSTAAAKVVLIIGTGAIGAPPSTGSAVANNTPLSQPAGLALDAKGNLYISDRGNSQIYKVDTAGLVTRVASNGTGRFTGDGRSALTADTNGNRGIAIGPDGNLYIADTGDQRIRKVDL